MFIHQISITYLMISAYRSIVFCRNNQLLSEYVLLKKYIHFCPTSTPTPIYLLIELPFIYAPNQQSSPTPTATPLATPTPAPIIDSSAH